MTAAPNERYHCVGLIALSSASVCARARVCVYLCVCFKRSGFICFFPVVLKLTGNSPALNHKRGDLIGPEFSAVVLESRHVQQHQQNKTHR